MPSKHIVAILKETAYSLAPIDVHQRALLDAQQKSGKGAGDLQPRRPILVAP